MVWIESSADFRRAKSTGRASTEFRRKWDQPLFEDRVGRRQWREEITVFVQEKQTRDKKTHVRCDQAFVKEKNERQGATDGFSKRDGI